MKVWITKYVETEGIVCLNVTQTDRERDSGSIYARLPHSACESFYGSEWHTAKERAVEKAKFDINEKIDNLKRRLLELE